MRQPINGLGVDVGAADVSMGCYFTRASERKALIDES